jgi:hypothetical protein
MRPSAEARRAGDTLEYWAHVYSPLDCAETYAVLVDGLAAVKRERLAALAAHDHDRAAVLLAEITELTYLCAELAEGIRGQRARYLASDRPWPLCWVL